MVFEGHCGKLSSGGKTERTTTSLQNGMVVDRHEYFVLFYMSELYALRDQRGCLGGEKSLAYEWAFLGANRATGFGHWDTRGFDTN